MRSMHRYGTAIRRNCLLLSACLTSSLLYAQNRMEAPRVLQHWNSIGSFSAGTKTAVQDLPIRTDIKKAIELSVHCLNSQFDRDRQDEPYFYCLRREDGTGQMLHAVEIGIPHVVGRSMLGSEMAELKAGVPFPARGLSIYERYCRQSFDNPDNLNSYYKDGKRGVELHNMREGLWSLWALIVRNNSEWAKDKAHKMLLSLERITDSSGNWSKQLADQYLTNVSGIMPDNQARMLDPLMAYYEATKDPLALTLAGLYAKVGLRLYDEKGKFMPFGKSSGHIHTLCSSLSGITRYAIFTRDKDMIQTCRKIMDNGVPEYFSSWGWGDEVMPAHPANVISQGEINQTGDVIRTALYLGAAGYPEYYEMAERYLRSMLLPAQCWRSDLVSFLKENASPKDDAEKDILDRALGGYGFPTPDARMRNGQHPVETQDITSGAVHALAECWEHRLVDETGQARLNLLFDAADNDFDIKSHLPQQGSISITAKTNKSLLIRIPSWVDVKSLRLSTDGTSVPAVVEDGYIRVAGLKKGSKAELSFDVPCRIEQETVDNFAYRTIWIGNQVISIKQLGTLSPLPF